MLLSSAGSRGSGGAEAHCAPLQAILLLVPAFLLIGWGRSLPVLGSGLLLYSFGEWAGGAQRGRGGGRGHSPGSQPPSRPPSRCCRGALPVLRGRRLW